MDINTARSTMGRQEYVEYLRSSLRPDNQELSANDSVTIISAPLNKANLAHCNIVNFTLVGNPNRHYIAKAVLATRRIQENARDGKFGRVIYTNFHGLEVR